MQGTSAVDLTGIEGESELRIGFVCLIAFIAAMGGLLFGYDWVVIGGAKPFYEAYFHLHSEFLIGWANSCALVGCFLGSLVAGELSERFGRKPVLAISAFLFAASSILTGWSFSFHAFIFWRILGGIAIGFASNVSPMYIAEISPAKWRGRLVSVNQLAVVVGILAAQIVNWRIAQAVPNHANEAMIAASWNALRGWRWMFTAVALPATAFLLALPAIPESPRWLISRGRDKEAQNVLERIGGVRYSISVRDSIQRTLARSEVSNGWRSLSAPPILKLLLIGITLAVLQQASGINVLFNYAEDVYKSAGYGVSEILFNIVITGSINLLFTLVAMATVDRFGRRSLMILGCIGVGISHLGAGIAFHSAIKGPWVLALTLSAIACYAMSLAPVTWVLISEIFPNQVRAEAISISVAALWVASFVLTYTFPMLNTALGTSGTFLCYGCICILGAAFIMMVVPETKGRSLESIGDAAIAVEHKDKSKPHRQ